MTILFNDHLPDDFHKTVAIECNNEAWELIEQKVITSEQLVNLLELAATARHHWYQIGTPSNKAHADLLYSFALSRANCAKGALETANKAYSFFNLNESKEWIMALTHAALAFAHFRNKNKKNYLEDYKKALSYFKKTNGEDLAIIKATFDILPIPVEKHN